MSYRVYIPCDTSAVAVGADKVAASLKSEAERLGLEVDIIRNGSRGMFWLEPYARSGHTTRPGCWAGTQNRYCQFAKPIFYKAGIIH